MGLEQYDFLYTQAQEMLLKLTSIKTALDEVLSQMTTTNENLSTISNDLILLHSEIEDYVQSGVVDFADEIKIKVDAVITQSLETGLIAETKTTVEEAEGIINSLIPLITTEVEKVYDGKTIYTYKCKQCSIKCKLPLPYVPLDKSVLKRCFLKGDDSAKFEQINVEVKN
jgi:hypothetical protein